MKHPLHVLLLVCCLLLAACGGAVATPTASPSASVSAVTLNVFAAASLKESFTEMATQYQKAHPNVKITFNFAGSQVLEQQIANGAPADIFASADLANMQKASTAGLVGASQVFAKNRLVVIVPANNPAGITSLKDLGKKGVKIVIGAVTVPAGKYSRQVLDKLAGSPDYGPTYRSAVLANIVSQEDNVKSVVQKVQLGEADAGFVYRTDVTAAVSSKVKVIDIPDTFNVVAQYPLAVVKNASHASEVGAFVQYVLSAEGQAILTKYHFIGKDG
ncbi:MAG: molybdate ABC transporter substrate-binding protein [Ktedonobacteraceae bacterium]|nr:molybdate ABC transporter substrate-binding protein [Ktedonobacteraceae bacterium]